MSHTQAQFTITQIAPGDNTQISLLPTKYLVQSLSAAYPPISGRVSVVPHFQVLCFQSAHPAAAAASVTRQRSLSHHHHQQQKQRPAKHESSLSFETLTIFHRQSLIVGFVKCCSTVLLFRLLRQAHCPSRTTS